MTSKTLIYCFSITLLCCIKTPSLACDVCGCSLGGFHFGLIPQTETHFFGMKFSRSRFYAEMNHANQAAEYSHDTYYRWDLMGRIALSKRWQINLIFPYLYNYMEGSHEQSEVEGLSDPIALMNYKLVDQKATEDNQWVHNLWVGAGIKAPIGKFSYSQAEQLINPNFQLGTGSWDYLLSGNYTINRDRWGMNIESSYKLNAINSQHYRFGNQFNAQANLFHTIPIGNILLIPYVGGYVERGDTHTFEGFQEVNTGGAAFLSNTGVQVQGKRVLLNMTYQQPLSQHFNSDQQVSIKAYERFSVTLIAFIRKSSGKELFNIIE